MTSPRSGVGTLRNCLIAGVTLAAAVVLVESPASLHARPATSSLCTMIPGTTLALLRVEQVTTLPFAPVPSRPMSMSGVPASPADSLLAMPGTPRPAARVRLLQLDSATRGILAAHGVNDSQPVAFMLAAPYRADCRTIRWTGAVPFVELGETGYVRATLAPREHWSDGVPLLVITDVWNYPYPRRRGLAFGVPADARLAPAEAMFSLNAALELPQAVNEETAIAAASAGRERALAWAAANLESAELEPVRGLVRRAVLAPDWRAAGQIPSRLRGTYRVDLQAGSERATWYFRTVDRPAYSYRADTLTTTVELLGSPHIAGYQLVGYAAGSLDSLPDRAPTGARTSPRVWLSAVDRPTAPGNDAQRSLAGELMFMLAATPERLWDDLEGLVRPMSASDSAFLARLNRPRPRGDKQPRIPIRMRIDERGGIRADTSLGVRGRVLRVAIERVDTLSVRRPF